MSTQHLSITTCLSCIAANRLVLSLRGIYYIHDLGNTTTATANSKPVYDLDSLGRFRELSSILMVVSSDLDTVGAEEEESYNRREELVKHLCVAWFGKPMAMHYSLDLFPEARITLEDIRDGDIPMHPASSVFVWMIHRPFLYCLPSV